MIFTIFARETNCDFIKECNQVTWEHQKGSLTSKQSSLEKYTKDKESRLGLVFEINVIKINQDGKSSVCRSRAVKQC
jgi:hypothetical protein